MEVNGDVSYDGNHNLSELMNKSKPGSHGSNNNTILMFLFLASSFSHLLIKQKPDVRVKIVLLTIFFKFYLSGCFFKLHLSRQK